ncbi:MAG: extracellular solute-binding protein [Firmicutes bacterium]|nr:extracellular solute-binding protein [Bacillota bacterium]
MAKRYTLALASVLSAGALMTVAVPAAAKTTAPVPKPAIKYPAYHKHVTITFWSWVPGIQHTVAAFEKAYPNIHVKYENVGAGSPEYEKLLTAIKAKQGAPDVVQLPYSELSTIAATGGLMNLDTLGAAKYKSNFEPWAWSLVSMGGGVYGIPQDQGPMALAYNVTIFKKYHLSVPKTWAQFESEAKELHQKAPGLYYNIQFNPSNQSLFKGIAWQLDGHVGEYVNGHWQFTVNDAAWKKVMSMVQTMTSKGWIPDNITSTLETDRLYDEDKVATVIAPAWEPLLLQEEAPKDSGQWRVADLPEWTPGKLTSGDWGGSSDAVTVQSKHPHAALLFALWINTNPTAISLDWTNGGLYPADIAGTHLPALSEAWPYYGNQKIGTVYRAMSSVVNFHYSYPPVMGYWSSEFGTLLTKAFAKHSSLTAILNTLNTDLTNFARTSGLLSAP